MAAALPPALHRSLWAASATDHLSAFPNIKTIGARAVGSLQEQEQVSHPWSLFLDLLNHCITLDKPCSCCQPLQGVTLIS